ncbi:MAG: ABC transporter ATP-binding protein [Bacteroidales bacterium]|nr:ABC transporter ATP-binding protein [Bacteroidales bacterium]MDZ4205254.1 ABC transporter ATP-binding protein [Bacteroidales bacterium]
MDTSTGIHSSLRKLISLFSRHEKIKAIGLLFLLMINAMMEMVGIGAIPAFILVVSSPYKVLNHPVSGMIARWLSVENERELLIVGSVGLIGLFIAKGLLTTLISYIRTRFVQYKYIDLSGRLFRSYMFAPYAFHLNRNTAELLRNLNTEAYLVVYNVFLPLMGIALNAITILFVLMLLLFVEPFFSLVALLGLGGVTWSMLKLVEIKTGKHGNIELHHRNISNKVILEGLSGVKEIRVLGREENFLSRYNMSVWLRAKAQFFLEMMQSVQRPVYETITVMGVLGLALMLTAREQSMERIIAVLALFAAATYRLMPTFKELMSQINNFRYYIYSVDPVYDDLQKLKENAIKNDAGNTQPLTFRSEIVIDGLSFSYPNSSETALNDVSLRIHRGSAIALVGESGAGKTTLVDALLGLLKIDKGKINVDGIDIFSDTRAWQRNIGYIPQSIYLSDDTLKRNVAFGLNDKEIDNEKFHRAATAAQLSELINRLPEKENTVIGERGIRLSGGQRQRIGIARALYHNPQLLIMDEGTSALDNITEKYVIEAIDRLKGDRTIIMIAHRLSTVKKCDHIFLMKNGKIISSGTYTELMNRSEEFRLMNQ